MSKPRRPNQERSHDSEQARKQHEEAKKFEKGELQWQKGAKMPDEADAEGVTAKAARATTFDWSKQKLREFPDYPIEQVTEVARMLYATEPFSHQVWRDTWRWTLLARQAYDFLDNLHGGCREVGGQRRAAKAVYDHAEARGAEAENLPDPVPFVEAVQFITRTKRKDRALPKLKTMVVSNPHYFGERFGKAPTLAEVNAQIKRWKKSGLPREEVAELRSLFEVSWPRIIAKQNREKAKKRKKRGPRFNAKEPLIGAVLREKAH